MDDLREKVARAIANNGALFDKWGEERWPHIYAANRVFAAIHASGHRIVPAKADQHMREVGRASVVEGLTQDFHATAIAADAYESMVEAYGQKSG